MAQDEVVALLFVLATVWLLAGGKPISALIACSFGVASGKIFLAVPLAALIVLLPGRPLWKKAVAGAGPAAFFYAWAFVASAVGGTRIPLLDFNPGVACSISVWVFLVQVGGLTFETARRLSGASVALALAGVVIAARRRHVVPTASSPVLLVAVTLLWTFSLFFHVNPEYYVLVLPVLLLVFPTWRAALGLIAASMLPWGVNFLYGVRNAAGDPSGGGGKEAFVRLYRSVLSADPGLLYNVALAMSVGVMLGLAIVVTAAMLRGSPAPTQAPAD
jgi:hypothetical protein